MVSTQSIYNFLTINSLVYTVGTISHKFLEEHKYSYPSILLFNTIVMGSFAYMINLSKREQPYITAGERVVAPDTLDFVKTVCVNSFSYYVVMHGILDQTKTTPLIYFIPVSFGYELFLDLCHYSAHRAIHSVPFLYRTIHKKHHSENRIQIYTSFSHTILDYLLTNTVPLLITSYVIPISPYFFTIQFCYKILVEIGGHSGKVNKAGSFPQFIWLPRFFKIELTNVDHNEHHINPMVNFSKRFSIWDKVFGTYVNKN